MTITGDRLRMLRKNNNKTLRDVENDTNIAYSGLAAIERGERSCNSTTLEILANYYGVSTDYLLGKTDEKDIQKVIVYDADGTITEMQHKLIDATKGMTTDDMYEICKYVDYIKSKK